MNTINTKDAEKGGSIPLLLIVENDTAISRVLAQALLSGKPYQFAIVPDGLRALQFVQKLKPHLILLSPRLPGLTGSETYDRFQNMKETKDIPVLFLSAPFPPQELEKRPVPFIHDPSNTEELLQTIERLLTLRSHSIP